MRRTVKTVSIDVTSRCNLCCAHCYNASGGIGACDMSDGVLLRVAKEVVRLSPESVCLCGGEPMLRRDVIAELRDCTHILHAGDIIKESDLDELRCYGSIYAVRGNNDRWQPGLRDLAGTLWFEIAGVSFVMTHEPYDIPRQLERV